METITMITTIAVALITAVFGPIAVAWARTKFEKKQKQTPMAEALETSKLINDQLENLMNDLGCDRVWIAQFHNGGNFYPTGKSIQKFSICYELVNIDTPRIQQTFQNIPVSLFPRVLSKIYKDGEIEILNAESEENSFGIDALTNQFKTKSISMIGLRSLDNHLIGVMGISYTQEHNVVQDEWDYIRKKSGVVGTLLSEYLYKTNKK
jgi:hypothetical protein